VRGDRPSLSSPPDYANLFFCASPRTGCRFC